MYFLFSANTSWTRYRSEYVELLIFGGHNCSIGLRCRNFQASFLVLKD